MNFRSGERVRTRALPVARKFFDDQSGLVGMYSRRTVRCRLNNGAREREYGTETSDGPVSGGCVWSAGCVPRAPCPLYVSPLDIFMSPSTYEHMQSVSFIVFVGPGRRRATKKICILRALCRAAISPDPRNSARRCAAHPRARLDRPGLLCAPLCSTDC